MSEKFLEQFAVSNQIITSIQLKELKSLQDKTRESFESVLQETGIFKIDNLYGMIASAFGLEYLANFDTSSIDPSINARLPMDYLDSNLIILISEESKEIVIGISSPVALALEGVLYLKLKKKIRFVLLKKSSLDDALQSLKSRHQRTMDEILEDLENLNDDSIEQNETEFLMDIANKAPIVRLVNMIIIQAIDQEVSDIHIEPFEKSLEVRFRLDGILKKIQSSPKNLSQAVTSRIKLLAKMDITEKRLPQDGKFKMVIQNKEYDIRVSTLPSYFGESVVLRILNNSQDRVSLTDTGIDGENYDKITELMHNTSGIILVTGPTGSGKTSTLYSMLSEYNVENRKLITVEDPVEYQMNGIVQMNVNYKIGLTFSSALRTILRQDPDIIMVGEIRDFETAEIAVQAALTGHLVYSTLHTNDAPSAIVRLSDMGVEPYLITASLIGVIAQRLVRRLCDSCKKAFLPDDLLLGGEGSNYATSCEPVGCEVCGNLGYRGRIGVFEVLTLSERIRQMIIQKESPGLLREAALKEGMVTMKKDGFEKVRKGITTLEEVFKAV